MTADLRQEIHHGLDDVTSERREFIQRAFRMLPALDQPRILDVGCGRGGPTLELARLSGGVVTGVDTNRQALNDLTAQAAAAGLSARVQVQVGSMSALDFADESFDIIWAEGSIHVIGFETGLNSWRQFLAPQGFLVIHEMAWLRPDPPAEIATYWRRIYPGIRTVAEYAAAVPQHGYRLVAAFALPDTFWGQNYFHPLNTRIRALRQKYQDNAAALATLDQEQRQVDLHQRYEAWYGSAYLVMQKQSA
jgi:SAM-dependent methyltransferase